ncbi:hypothetical protein ABZ929_25420 [Streptomyces physcomitrii]|uniref:hypothetical protein n=1 Tax=Streptomyces physcomitrii TaxID=2724184 RepID=UPI00343FD301
MICVRCQQGITPGEPYEEHHHDSSSAAGCTNYSHKRCPEDEESAGFSRDDR